MQIIFLSISPKLSSPKLHISYNVSRYCNASPKSTGEISLFNQMQLKQPDVSTSMLSISTLIEYQAHTAVVIEFDKQFLLSMPTIRSFDSSSFLNARITVLPAIVS